MAHIFSFPRHGSVILTKGVHTRADSSPADIVGHYTKLVQNPESYLLLEDSIEHHKTDIERGIWMF